MVHILHRDAVVSQTKKMNCERCGFTDKEDELRMLWFHRQRRGIANAVVSQTKKMNCECCDFTDKEEKLRTLWFHRQRRWIANAVVLKTKEINCERSKSYPSAIKYANLINQCISQVYSLHKKYIDIGWVNNDASCYTTY